MNNCENITLDKSMRKVLVNNYNVQRYYYIAESQKV